MRNTVPKDYQDNKGIYNQDTISFNGINRKLKRLANKMSSGKKKYGFKKNTTI